MNSFSNVIKRINDSILNLIRNSIPVLAPLLMLITLSLIVTTTTVKLAFAEETVVRTLQNNTCNVWEVSCKKETFSCYPSEYSSQIKKTENSLATLWVDKVTFNLSCPSGSLCRNGTSDGKGGIRCVSTPKIQTCAEKYDPKGTFQCKAQSECTGPGTSFKSGSGTSCDAFKMGCCQYSISSGNPGRTSDRTLTVSGSVTVAGGYKPEYDQLRVHIEYYYDSNPAQWHRAGEPIERRFTFPITFYSISRTIPSDAHAVLYVGLKSSQGLTPGGKFIQLPDGTNNQTHNVEINYNDLSPEDDIDDTSDGTTNRRPNSGGTVRIPAPTTPGFCANDQRGGTVLLVGSPTCTINNATWDQQTPNTYCQQEHGGASSFFYYCNVSNPTGGTTSPPPVSQPQGPATGPCALEKGGIKPGADGYIGAMCGGNPYDYAQAATGKFCNTKYTDRYTCNNIDPATGKNYIDDVPGSDATCNTSAWCPSNAGAVCRGGSGIIDCSAVNGPNYSCTYDYTNSKTDTPTHCCKDGKRWCPTASACVPDSDGCGGLLAGIGQQCGEDAQCRDAASGVKCLNFTGGFKTCQWPVGVNPPSPTPGAATNCNLAAGMAGVGCECPQGGGCGPGLSCYPEAQRGNIITGPFYCTGTGTRWCAHSNTSTTTPATCGGGNAYVPPSPTPRDLGYQADCPNINPVSGRPNSCDLGSCQAGYGPNRIGPGGTNGSDVCKEVKGPTAVCCTQLAPSAQPTTTSAPSPSPAAGGTATTCNSPLQCQAGADGLTNETCVTGWDNIGKRNCTLNTTCCQKR